MATTKMHGDVDISDVVTAYAISGADAAHSWQVSKYLRERSIAAVSLARYRGLGAPYRIVTLDDGSEWLAWWLCPAGNRRAARWEPVYSLASYARFRACRAA